MFNCEIVYILALIATTGVATNINTADFEEGGSDLCEDCVLSCSVLFVLGIGQAMCECGGGKKCEDVLHLFFNYSIKIVASYIGSFLLCYYGIEFYK
jgi:hypothetical protein